MDFGFAAFLLVEADGQFYRRSAAALQKRQEVRQGNAGVDDVFHHDDMLTADVLVQILFDFYMAAGNGAIAIAGNAHGIQSDRQVDFPHQVAEEWHRPFEDSHQDHILAFVVFGDGCADFLHSSSDLFFSDQNGFDIFF